MIDVILVNILFAALVALSFELLLSTLAQSEFQMMQFIPIIIVRKYFLRYYSFRFHGKPDPIYRKIPPSLSYAGHAHYRNCLRGPSILNLESDLAFSNFLVYLGAFSILLDLNAYRRYNKIDKSEVTMNNSNIAQLQGWLEHHQMPAGKRKPLVAAIELFFSTRL